MPRDPSCRRRPNGRDAPASRVTAAAGSRGFPWDPHCACRRVAVWVAVTDDLDAMVEQWLPLPDVAERLGIDANRVRQLVKDHQLLARRRGERAVLQVPEAFVRDGKVLKGLPGTITLLTDAGFTDDEALRWLFTP